jgi:hypothetical protein
MVAVEKLTIEIVIEPSVDRQTFYKAYWDIEVKG